MDDIPAAEVDGALLREPAAAPDQKRADGIDGCHPERHEEHPGLEVHSAQEGTAEDDHCDRAENELEVDHRGGRETKRRQSSAIGQQRNRRLAELSPGEVDRPRYADDVLAEEMGGVSEAHVVAPERPDQ